MAAKFEIDVQPFLDILKSSTDRLQGLTVCMEALDDLTETLKVMHEEIGEETATFEPTEENLANAAAKREEFLEDIQASVAAIVYTDRFLAQFKTAATD